MEFWAAHAMVNQKSLVVLSQALLQHNPSTSVANNNLGIAFMNYYERHSVKQNFLGEWGVMKSYIDHILAKKFHF